MPQIVRKIYKYETSRQILQDENDRDLLRPNLTLTYERAHQPKTRLRTKNQKVTLVYFTTRKKGTWSAQAPGLTNILIVTSGSEELRFHSVTGSSLGKWTESSSTRNRNALNLPVAEHNFCRMQSN